MKITRIYIKDNKLNPMGYVKTAVLKENHGIVGDIHARGGNRQVSIFTEEGRCGLETLEEHGLCSARFIENITIDNLIIKDVKVKDRIIIGKVILEITEIGKKCYKDCNLINNNKHCLLTLGIIYGKIICGGLIKTGDIVII